MASANARSDHATLADLLRILRVRRQMVFVLAALVVLVAAAVTALLPKWYLATATVRVEKPDSQVQLFQSNNGSYYDPYFLQDQYRIMLSPMIIQPVIEHLELNRRLGEMLGNPGPLPSDITSTYLVEKMLQLESPRNSSLIEINVYAQQPQLAADIANEIARVYSENRIDFATSEQRESLAQLRRELDTQERNVTAQRDRVEQLRDELNLAGVDLNARVSDMEIDTLRQMQNTLIALRVDAIGRRTRWERFRDIPFDDRINLVNSELIDDLNIQNLLQAFLVADQTLARLRSRLGEAHPDLVAAIENREKIRQQLDGQLRGYESALEISYNEAEARVAELERQLGQAKVDQILSARDRLRPFEEAVHNLEDETRLLTTLRLTLRQREIDFQVPKRTIELLGAGEAARRPSKPNWTLNLAFAVLVGMMLGVGVAVAIEYFDTSLRSVADVEGKLKVPVLGIVPHRSDSGEFDYDEMALSEPFRVLQTNLDLALPSGKSAAMVMVSAGPGEGKSTTIHRLANVIGRTGERVILIDADLRRPTQHKLGGWPREPGLADYLQGKAELDAVIRTGAAPGLDVIPCGRIEGFTLGLLHRNRLQELVAVLRERYSRVLFDSPPLIGVSDASVLASVMDGALLLIQHRRNPASMVLRAQQILTSARSPLLGAVLNQVPSRSGEDYEYYTRNYDYYGDQGSGRRKRSSRVKTEQPTRPDAPEALELDEDSERS